jgi:hypothetical protein
MTFALRNVDKFPGKDQWFIVSGILFATGKDEGQDGENKKGAGG